MVRGDVSQFDDVMAAMTMAKPQRAINLAYWLGSEHPPRVAFKLNVLGMDNVFEAARLVGCNRPYRERVLQIINDIRKEEGLPELARQ